MNRQQKLAALEDDYDNKKRAIQRAEAELIEYQDRFRFYSNNWIEMLVSFGHHINQLEDMTPHLYQLENGRDVYLKDMERRLWELEEERQAERRRYNNRVEDLLTSREAKTDDSYWY